MPIVSCPSARKKVGISSGISGYFYPVSPVRTPEQRRADGAGRIFFQHFTIEKRRALFQLSPPILSLGTWNHILASYQERSGVGDERERSTNSDNYREGKKSGTKVA